MKTFLYVMLFAANLRAETLVGHLMPFKCQKDDQKTHTRVCALRPECRVTGFGIALDNGTFVQFDAKGNAQAVRLLERSVKADDLIAEATGTHEGTLFKLKTIRLK